MKYKQRYTFSNNNKYKKQKASIENNKFLEIEILLIKTKDRLKVYAFAKNLCIHTLRQDVYSERSIFRV